MKGLDSLQFDEKEIEEMELEDIENAVVELANDLILTAIYHSGFSEKGDILICNAKLILATNILAHKLNFELTDQLTADLRQEVIDMIKGGE